MEKHLHIQLGKQKKYFQRPFAAKPERDIKLILMM